MSWPCAEFFKLSKCLCQVVIQLKKVRTSPTRLDLKTFQSFQGVWPYMQVVRVCWKILEDSKSRRVSKLHFWFNKYICFLVELHPEVSAPAACALLSRLVNLWKQFYWKFYFNGPESFHDFCTSVSLPKKLGANLSPQKFERFYINSYLLEYILMCNPYFT